MGNSGVLGKRRRGAANSALKLSFFVGLLALSAFGTNQPSDTPPPFACEVRYHFREDFQNAKPGEKRVSAPSHQREPLPLPRVDISDGSAARIVEGSVAHLPYRFVVRIIPSTDAKVGTLEVNVLDDSGKSLPGFPKVGANALVKTGDSTQRQFELPVSDLIKKKIEKTLLAKGQFLTHVDLTVGMDEDFLSADFPK